MDGKNRPSTRRMVLLAGAVALASATVTLAEERIVGKTSYAPVAGTEAFSTVKETMEKQKTA